MQKFVTEDVYQSKSTAGENQTTCATSQNTGENQTACASVTAVMDTEEGCSILPRTAELGTQTDLTFPMNSDRWVLRTKALKTLPLKHFIKILIYLNWIWGRNITKNKFMLTGTLYECDMTFL